MVSQVERRSAIAMVILPSVSIRTNGEAGERFKSSFRPYRAAAPENAARRVCSRLCKVRLST
jgi:hypothetical protein